MSQILTFLVTLPTIANNNKQVKTVAISISSSQSQNSVHHLNLNSVHIQNHLGDSLIILKVVSIYTECLQRLLQTITYIIMPRIALIFHV